MDHLDRSYLCQSLTPVEPEPHPIYDCGACEYMGHRVTEVADALVVYVYCHCTGIAQMGDAP